MTKAEARQFWSPIINDFQPLDSVWRHETDKLGRYYVDRSAGDPTSSTLEILKEGLLASLGRAKPYRALLTGHRGSGKSSELMRLGEELAGDYFVVRFDAEMILAPESTNHFDIILGMGIAIFAAAQFDGLKPDRKLAEGLLDSLSKFIRNYEEKKGFKLDLTQLLKQVSVGVIKFGALSTVSPALALTAAAFEATRLELNVGDEQVRTLELPANRVEVIGALNRIIRWVEEKSGKRMLLIVDGLDKVTTGRARLLFADSSLLGDPSCAMVYAAPIVFYHRAEAWQAEQRFDAYEMLPNVPVFQQLPRKSRPFDARKVNPGGIAVMRRVVERRLELRGLEVDGVIEADAFSQLAQMSGGVMRQLIQRFNKAATYAKMLGKERIDQELADRSVLDHRKQLKARWNNAYRLALTKVLGQRELTGAEAEDEMLTNDYLLSYRNETDVWLDAHPNVLPLLRG
jgi:hypothetical protein